MKTMVRILLGCLLSYSVAHAQLVTIPIPGSPLSLNVMANPQPLQNIHTNPASTAYQLWDDGWANVPLSFDFPFFGKKFNNSTMYSNGAVQFGAPVDGFPGNNTFCCNGITIDRTTPSSYNYSILVMQTDMYGASGKNHYSLGTKDTMTYGWYDVERLGDPANKTNFELKIDSKGGIDMRWSGAVITMNTPAIGIIGDASLGEFSVIQQGSLPGTFTLPGLTQWTTGQTPDVLAIDQCTINPLYSPTCSGYQAAYLIQQCSIDALYATTCSGYQSAYTSQQCSLNALYDSSCTGYQTAYYDQQCLADSLYDINCPGYARAYLNQQCSLNPLYSTTCSGYAAAYKTQQCTASALYATDCPGYDVAYKTQQCTASALYAKDCPGYDVAYLNQQCSLNSLYATTCSGYDVAYKTQQCIASALYATDCPGYAVAYKTQQCSANALYATDCPGYEIAYLNAKCIIDSLYSNKCEGYATTYAIKYLVTNIDSAAVNSSLSNTAAVKANDPTNTIVATNTASTTIANDGTVSTAVSTTGDTNVDKAIAPKPPSAAGNSPTAAVQLVASPPPAAPPEQKQEAKPSANNNQQAQANDSNAPKPAPTARQEIQAKREAAAKAKAVEDGKNLAENVGKATDMEQQKQVQNVVLQAMGYTPGFDAYSKAFIQDVVGYKPFTVYGNQKTIDNRNNLRMFSGTDTLHNEMVDSQYKRK